MNCEILETLYVKSNGDIPCNCDTGEKVLLGRIEPEDPSWNISEVLTNSMYSHIRTSLPSGKIPWEGICINCAFLRRDEPFSDNLSYRRIRKVQIEPSLSCNLKCPCCSNRIQIKSRPKPHLMKIEVFEILLQSLSQQSYIVEEIEYCGQGEPLMNRKLPEFVRKARQYYPCACQRLITSGNFDYWDTVQGVFIDEIFISCDGVFQNSYEKYRIGGIVNRPIKFMKDIPKNLVGKKIWKYILFEFNDSDEELIAAQHLANSIGVDILMFVFTHSKFKSIKYMPENVAKIPILYSNVTTNITPQFLNRDVPLISVNKLQKKNTHLNKLRSLFRISAWSRR